jgi:Asp-tRNA(Asn)/Glu-tRNA(Gln) amidotransferase C subunit
MTTTADEKIERAKELLRQAKEVLQAIEEVEGFDEYGDACKDQVFEVHDYLRSQPLRPR